MKMLSLKNLAESIQSSFRESWVEYKAHLERAWHVEDVPETPEQKAAREKRSRYLIRMGG